MNEIIKLIEGIITECNAKEKVYFGIDCNANNYYLEDQKLYEMEGMKKPIDVDQLIDFYIKLCTDHPSLIYLEDPIASKDLKGWKKLLEKAIKNIVFTWIYCFFIILYLDNKPFSVKANDLSRYFQNPSKSGSVLLPRHIPYSIPILGSMIVLGTLFPLPCLIYPNPCLSYPISVLHPHIFSYKFVKLIQFSKKLLYIAI